MPSVRAVSRSNALGLGIELTADIGTDLSSTDSDYGSRDKKQPISQMPVSTEQDLFLYMTRGSRLFAIFMIAKQTLTLSARSEDRLHQEDRAAPKAVLTASALQMIVPIARPAGLVLPSAFV